VSWTNAEGPPQAVQLACRHCGKRYVWLRPVMDGDHIKAWVWDEHVAGFPQPTGGRCLPNPRPSGAFAQRIFDERPAEEARRTIRGMIEGPMIPTRRPRLDD